jgi:pentalenene oxygenase
LFEAHRRHRRALQPAFHPRRVAAQVPQVRELTQTHCRHWQAGQTLRLDQDLARLAYDVTARTFCTATDSMASALAALTASSTTGVYWRVALPRLGRLSGVPGTGSFKRAVARLRAAITSAIEQHRADPRDRGDVLSALLSARYHDTGEAMSDEQIVNEITFYMFAAVHGIADVLPHVFLELSRHPDAEERLHAELDTVLSGRPVQAEDLPRLHYTRRLLTEVMRLHPTVWLLARRTLRTVRLGITDFPAGTEIAYGAYAAHHHPGIHHEPLRFDPDRWLPERTRALHKVAQLTFGTGPRKCIGDQLATTHMLTALATITQHWRLRTPPGHRHRPTPRLFLRPGTLPALITQRTPMRTTSAVLAQS